MTEQEKVCRNCYFWTQKYIPEIDKQLADTWEYDNGICHRNPPQFNERSYEEFVKTSEYESQDMYWGYFPRISGGEWCGEWAARIETDEHLPLEVQIRILEDKLNMIRKAKK